MRFQCSSGIVLFSLKLYWFRYLLTGPKSLSAALVRPSRCHLLQTSTRNLLALRPGGAGASVPGRDPQSHRGGQQAGAGLPERTTGPDHLKGAFVTVTQISPCVSLLTKMIIERLSFGLFYSYGKD